MHTTTNNGTTQNRSRYPQTRRHEYDTEKAYTHRKTRLTHRKYICRATYASINGRPRHSRTAQCSTAQHSTTTAPQSLVKCLAKRLVKCLVVLSPSYDL